MTRPVMDEVGDLALRPEVVQAGIILQAVFYPLIQVGDGEYLGQDISFWTGSICELPRPEGRGFPRHRQNLHHGYVVYWFWFDGRYGLFHPCDEYIPGSIVVSIT